MPPQDKWKRGEHLTTAFIIKMKHSFYYKDETIFLSGSARDRRKQFRLLRKKYPNCTLKGLSVIKTLNGKRIECEEANIVRTQVNIK